MRSMLVAVSALLVLVLFLSGCASPVSSSGTPEPTPVASPLTSFSLSMEKNKFYIDPEADITFNSATRSGTINLPSLPFGTLDANYEELYVEFETAAGITSIEFRTDDGTGYSIWENLDGNVTLPLYKEISQNPQIKILKDGLEYMFDLVYSEALPSDNQGYISFEAEKYYLLEKSVIWAPDNRLFILRGYTSDMTKEVRIELRWDTKSPNAYYLPTAGNYSEILDTLDVGFTNGFTMVRVTRKTLTTLDYEFYYNNPDHLVDSIDLDVSGDNTLLTLDCEATLSDGYDFLIMIPEGYYSNYQADE